MLYLSQLQKRIINKHVYILACVLVLFCLKLSANLTIVASHEDSPITFCACIDDSNNCDDYVAAQHHNFMLPEPAIVNFPEPSRLIINLGYIAQQTRGPPKYLR
jgi:hypothetical protein